MYILYITFKGKLDVPWRIPFPESLTDNLLVFTVRVSFDVLETLGYLTVMLLFIVIKACDYGRVRHSFGFSHVLSL